MLKKMKRTIAMVTSSRADYRYVYWVMKHLKEDRYVNLQVIVTGMHLSSEFGNTYQELIKDGFSIDQKVEMLVSSNTSAGMAESTGLGVSGFAKVFEKNRPDVVVLTGDRFEMLSFATAAILMCIPIAQYWWEKLLRVQWMIPFGILLQKCLIFTSVPMIELEILFCRWEKSHPWFIVLIHHVWKTYTKFNLFPSNSFVKSWVLPLRKRYY